MTGYLSDWLAAEAGCCDKENPALKTLSGFHLTSFANP